MPRGTDAQPECTDCTFRFLRYLRNLRGELHPAFSLGDPELWVPTLRFQFSTGGTKDDIENRKSVS
jgi:hypothetical protein